MKTKIFGGIALLTIAAAMAFNVSLNTDKNNQMSALALANVEALAGGETMTDEEFTKKTDCIAVQDDINCKGKDGVTYSFAKKKDI